MLLEISIVLFPASQVILDPICLQQFASINPTNLLVHHLEIRKLDSKLASLPYASTTQRVLEGTNLGYKKLSAQSYLRVPVWNPSNDRRKHVRQDM